MSTLEWTILTGFMFLLTLYDARVYWLNCPTVGMTADEARDRECLTHAERVRLPMLASRWESHWQDIANDLTREGAYLMQKKERAK